jgi:NAD(P)-dependent dehydrogenase (short-subunit alcohol dehydrogenase family)
MEQLKNKVALVTGAGSGIGKCVAELYAANGAGVVISDIDEKGGNAVAEGIKSKGGSAVFIKSDTSNPSDCEQLVAKTLEQFGQLDIACNNAGIGGADAHTGEKKLEEWHKVININLNGVF